jgi:hypothetical protein
MRRALRARDQGCRFPGCTNSHYVDGHHIEHWANGGETSLRNLVLLCRHHHRLVHEGGFGCERGAGRKIEFKDPTGAVLPEWHGSVPTQYADDPVSWFHSRLNNIDIDANTCVTRWQGERMDWNLAVGHLFN